MTTAHLLCGYNLIIHLIIIVAKSLTLALPEMKHFEDIMAREERPIPFAENVWNTGH
jgi:hypothetical protein